MEREIQQLVEMGATRAQARAALKQHKDVMEAAERIFDGSFDNVVEDDGDVEMAPAREKPKVSRMITPDDDDDDDDKELEDPGDDYDDDDVEDFADYDSDYEAKAEAGRGPSNADPYAGIFFSKDRREEVIEVEEEPETVFVPDAGEQAKLMTQGQWMKGCPEGGEQSFLFSLYQELTDGDCRCPNGCQTSFPRQKRDFFPIFAEFDTYTKHLRTIVPRLCGQCHKRFCFACGEPISESQGNDEDTLFHCPNLQGVILGVGLAMLEQSFVEETSSATPQPTNGKRRKAEALPVPATFDDDDDDEDAYPPVTQTKKLKLGVGYAGDAREDTSGHLEALRVQRGKDETLSKLLFDIRVFLPSVHREGGGKPSDYLVHPTALAHLRRRFNFVGSQLLRNDSLADMSDRSVLYFELLNWLETISCHEALASMMAMPIMVVTSAKAMPNKKSGSGKQCVRERTITYEGSSGPRELLEAIVIQAQAALKGLEPLKLAEDAKANEMTEEQKRQTMDPKGKGRDDGKVVLEENQKLLGFCKSIISTAKAIDRSLRETKGDAFVDRLHASLPKIPGASSSENDVVIKPGQSEEDAQKAYLDWANKVRFEYCDLTVESPAGNNDGSPHYKFVYNNEARMLANADIPKRSLAIAKELAVLTTNLPVAWNSSVFLRVDESRVDVIKALITGPEGTPYHNGCYLFDIFLGASYNQAPPSVKYVTTNGGKYRFNPNLYADGKVCLSLLGTWQGPGWVAGRSTLLQVLISIQSMILCDEPYLNEPAWANSSGTPASKSYSANVRRMVVKTAMLGNLKNPPEPFADVIRTHFRIKANTIIKQMDEWLEQDDGKMIAGENHGQTRPPPADDPVGNGLRADVDELKALLSKLSNGEDVVVEGGAGPSSR